MRSNRRLWVLIVGGLLCLAPAGALVVSVAHPVERVRTQVLLGLERGQLIVAWTSAPMNPGFFGGGVRVVRHAGGGAGCRGPAIFAGSNRRSYIRS